METGRYIEENRLRNEERARKYDPVTGEGSDTCERREFHCPHLGIYHHMLPFDCFNEPIIQGLMEYGSVKDYLHAVGLKYTRANKDLVYREYVRARCRHDFEYTASKFFYIKDKDPRNPKDILFVPNRGQRVLLKAIYEQDKQHMPVRIIVDKSRQIGFSTLIDMYMAWKQLFVLRGMNAEIVAHVENTARIIRGMYSKMIAKLPAWLLGLPDETKLKLSPFERGNKTLIVKEIGCRITIGSSEKPDNLAGDDISMVHFSEVALYKSTTQNKPDQLIQTIIGGMAYLPNTMVFYESTARGVGNFFHSEWLAAVEGKSNFKAVFVPWFYMDLDKLPIRDYKKFVESMTDYERFMFKEGATLEGIAWYRKASKAMKDQWRWKSERPTTAEESFQSTGHRLYPQDDVIRLRKNVKDPTFIGEIYGKNAFGDEATQEITFKEERDGSLQVWFMPEKDISKTCNDRYVVIVDIGGCSDHSDRSVICVIDRYDMVHGGVPIVCAEWCGHIDHDLLAWKAVQMATAYDNALLVIESNTLETEGTEGDHFDYILDEIAYYYSNLYCRISADKIKMGFEPIWGFHTNKKTKRMVCDHHKKALRENLYIETCAEAVNEHDYMEIKSNGSIGAVEGKHDDRHITRAIGIWICYDYLNQPRKIEPRKPKALESKTTINESTI